jgi:hypothetical protein
MKSRSILYFCFVVIITGMLLGGAFFSTRAAPAYAAPGISVSPSSGAAGSSATISGSGFEPGGYEGTVQWDGAAQSTFTIPSGGGFSVDLTIPSGASAGNHVISVCAACGDGDVEQRASTNFSVTAPFVPVVPLPPSVPVGPSLPGVCTSFNLGPDSEVITFGDWSPGTRLGRVYTGRTEVYFTPGSAYIDFPPVAAHSGRQAVRSAYDDFGSAGHPIVFSFPDGKSAVGLYVGRETPGVNNNETLFAVLTAYGYDASLNLVEIASDQVPLPAEATPIQRCVVVHAPAGQAIRSLILDYVTADGVSAYDRRWVDDLTFIGAISLPDAPPSVQILYPADGSSPTSDNVSILAQVHEDIRLSSVDYTLNNSDFFPMTFTAVVGSDPTLYEARAIIPAANLRGDIPNPLLVRATDSTYQTGEASVRFGYTPAGVGDIWITGIEVTQAIQTLDNRIPLIAYKPTAVRVYVRSTEDVRGPWTGLMARMTVNGHSYAPALVDPRVGIPASPMGSDRYSTNDSFVFLLNTSDTAQGSRNLQASIYMPSGRPESNSANNTRSQAMTFNPPVYLSMYGVTYGNLNPTLGPAPWSDFEAHRSFTRTVFPVTNFTIRQLPGNPSPSFDNSMGTAYIQAREVWATRMLASMPTGARIYLLQPEGDGLTGMASQSGWMNGQNVQGEGVGWVMAQEAGHSFGLWWHAPGNDAADPNYDYPYRSGNIGPQTGFDTRTLQALPINMRDIMSYYNPNWISPFTYCALLRVIPGAVNCPAGVERASVPGINPLTVANLNPFSNSMLSEASYSIPNPSPVKEDQYLFIAGHLNPDGTAAFFPFEVINSSENKTSVPPGSGYRMALRDGSGNVLASYDFQPLVTHAEPNEPIGFSLVVPFDPAMKRVSLYQDNTLLADRKASSHAPQVTLLTPNGGEDWSGQQTITWQGTDADNDPLTYTVEYSPDGGQTWTPLNTGLTTNSLDVNFDTVPGSKDARVRVSASDGMNTTAALSANGFNVPIKGPQISINQPAKGASYLESVPFMVSAEAFDWQDGPINNPDSYSWSSDKDGQLGSGSWIVLSSLTPGEHTLTVTVSDSNGKQASASVQVTINALETSSSAATTTPAPTPTSAITPFHLPAWVWIAVGLFVLLLLSGAGFILLRLRK